MLVAVIDKLARRVYGQPNVMAPLCCGRARFQSIFSVSSRKYTFLEVPKNFMSFLRDENPPLFHGKTWSFTERFLAENLVLVPGDITVCQLLDADSMAVLSASLWMYFV